MDKKEFHRQKRDVEQSEDKHKSLKLQASLVPGGAKAYDLFKILFEPLYLKRKNEWFNLLMYDLVRREEDGLISLEALSNNEEFLSTVTKATLKAQQTHQQEKLKALRNVVVNGAVSIDQDKNLFDWSDRFLHIIGEISPMHILLLKAFRYPANITDEAGIKLKKNEPISNKDLFFEIYPNLKGRVSLINLCWRELVNYGFVINDTFDVGRGKLHTNEKLLPKTTDFGNKFLDMIEREA